MAHSHNTGASNEKEDCQRYYARNRKQKNKERKASKLAKFLKWCKEKWLKGNRTPKGTERARRRKEKREGKTLQSIK